jgi:hypothetical protein
MVLLTPWMGATLIDFYFNVALLAALVCLREKVCARGVYCMNSTRNTVLPALPQSTIFAVVWVTLLICFGSATTWLYVWLVALKARPGDSIAKLLLG